ncbi:hypothetical protein [Ancylobacter novellus]|uniref:hypothetical protein n=1 Tax=Ancylobacter novellus TaxID=921 RepID=UPI0016514AEC|nr:hypothetical protein [Ancylobacter novellus]
MTFLSPRVNPDGRRPIRDRVNNLDVMPGLGPPSAFADGGLLETELGQARVLAIHVFLPG